MTICKSRVLALVALAGSLVWLSLLPGGGATAADPDKTERTVTVSATGSVNAEPDIAHITAGVVTEAGTAKEAIARNSAVMAKLIDGLKGAGIAPKDLQTTQINVEPRYTQAKPAAIGGYRVSNLVRLTVRDVKRLGEIADLAISLGANQISQISFAVSDAEKLTDEARRNAMANARRRGELYAKAAGAELGPVLRISEDLPDLGAGVTAFGIRKSAPPPIEAGTRRLVVEVSVVYALR